MIRINLLPHREEKRRLRRQQFYTLSALMVVLGCVIGLLVHGIYASRIERQEARNAFLRAESANLGEQIGEIGRLREQIDALLARKQVIEALQGHRAEMVQLMNELARAVPEGVVLKSLKQDGDRITLVGHAQSNARVSHLMRNMDDSAFLERAALVEVKAVTLNNRRVSEFTLGVGIERPAPQAGDAKVAKQGNGVGK